jgi:hypothetical protein
MSSARPIPQPSPHKKTSPLVWILGGLAILLFGGMVTCGLLGFFAMRAVKNAGFDPDLMKRNPGLAMAKMAATLHPDLEIVSTDDRAGKIVMRNKKDGKEVAFRFDPDKKTLVMTGDDGKDVTITASGEGADGRVTLKSADSSVTFGAGGSAKLPDWVPVYPGTSPQGVYSAKTPDGSQNTFTFRTNDSASKVSGYYQEQFKAGGLTVSLTTSGDNGGLVTAESGDKKQSVVVTISAANGVTNVSVTAVEKK